MEKSKKMEGMRRGCQGGWGDLDGEHSADPYEPLFTACQEGRAEVIEQLLRGGADATLCTPQGRTALHVCPPGLQGALLGWMLRPHLPPQACLWRAAWLGDLHTLRQLLAGPDTVDLNAPNPDGLTALMLSVRDVVLMENVLSSPWQPRHGEVVRELLLLSVDVCIRDNRGWSALDYALNITGPHKDDIVHMLQKVLAKTEGSPGPCFPLDRHSSSDLGSECEASGSDDPAPGQHTDRRPGSTRTAPRHWEGELLQSSEGSPLSHQNKMNRHDKRLPFCFQIAMETQSDIRQTDQDAERGSRGSGSSLPSLSEWTKPAVGQRESGTRSTRSRSPSLQTGAPKREHLDGLSSSRRQSQVSGSPRLVLGPQQPTSCLLSQSAPSVMVPLLDSNTLLLARAHIHTRLGSHENDRNGNGRNSSMPAPPPHILPQLLAPLDSRTKGPMVVPQLHHPAPLKPIRGVPSRTLRTLLRRERLSRGSGQQHVGHSTTRGGSEESSSSNQSSIDLDDEAEEDVERELTSTYFLKAEAGERGVRAKTSGQRLHVVRHVAMGHSLPNVLDRDPIVETRDSIDIGKPLMSDSIRVGVNTAREVFENELVQLNSDREDQMINPCVDNEMHHQIKSYPNEEYTSPACIKGTAKYINCDPDDRCSERQCRLGDGRDVVVLSLGKSPHRSMNGSPGDGEDVKPCTVMTSATIAVVERSQYPTTTVNLTLSQKNCKKSPVKLAKTKERRTNGKIRNRATNSQFPQAFNILNGSKSKLDPNSVSATQVKTRVRKTPNLVVKGEATVSSVKSKPNSVEVAQQNADTPVARESVTVGHRIYSKGLNSDRSNDKGPHVTPVARELRSARQPKRTPVAVATPRSKSAVDFITYKDMFQTINRGDDGPAIYEMFAGPMYDKLRISGSCDNPKAGTVSTPPRNSHHTFRVKKQPLKKLVEHKKLRRSPAEKMVVSSAGKRKTLSASKAAPCLTAGQAKDTHKMEDVPKLDLPTEPESFLTEESEEEEERYLEPSSDRGGDQMMSVIQEVQSGYGSETLKPDELSTARRMQRGQSSRRHDIKDLQDGHELNVHNLRTSSDHSGSSRDRGERHPQVPEPVRSQSPLQTKINSRTSHRSNGTFSPVYRDVLHEVGEGPVTDELLKCLAEELISLDETDTSIGPSPTNFQPLGSRGKGEGPGRPRQKMPEISSTLDSVVEDTITWTKGEVLGRGAYGTVFCGLTNQGTLIAVKQVSLDSSEPAAADREYGHLQEEVELLKNLTHTNIVGFLGTSLRQHMVSIFMEYVPGGSIASVLHRFGPLPEHVLSLYSHQILEGVAYLHLNRVVHRDLKGNNIMLMPTGVVKLIDFGCARRLSRLNPAGSHSGDLIKSVHGTPYWMAPEVITESGYGRKSDIWSVGCTVFEMATGKPPLAHMDKLAALFYIGAQRGSMPSLPDGFSRHASNFVDICLTSDQKLRPSAEQLLKHPFIPNRTRENSLETQRRPCCAAHPEGFCHR